MKICLCTKKICCTVIVSIKVPSFWAQGDGGVEDLGFTNRIFSIFFRENFFGLTSFCKNHFWHKILKKKFHKMLFLEIFFKVEKNLICETKYFEIWSWFQGWGSLIFTSRTLKKIENLVTQISIKGYNFLLENKIISI